MTVTLTLTPEDARLLELIAADMRSWSSPPPTPSQVLTYALKLAVMYLAEVCELELESEQ